MGTVPSPSFGDLLKRFRVRAGMTQEQLAEAARLSARAISDLERGIKRSPRRETIDLLARALNLTPAERSTLEAVSPRRGAPLTQAGAYVSAGPRHDGPDTPLVGRVREIGTIRRHLAAEGVPVLLLAGEPGIGKTSLLRHAAATARDAGLTVLEGGCTRRSGQEPYAPLLQAIERHLASLSSAQRRAALLGCAWLVRLLPELAETSVVPAPAWTLPAEQERRLMFSATVRLLANVAGPAGTLLVLDDLQWAGPDALDLLATLVADEQGSGVRVVAAYRDTETQPNDTLATLLADLANAKLAHQIQIGPLEPAEAATLAHMLLANGETTKPEREEQLLARAGGMPFYLVSCAQAMRAGSLDDSDAVPWDVAQGIQQRLTALPRSAQDLLNLAAVMGRSAPRTLLVAVASGAGLEEREALDALEAICRTRLLVEESESEYAFAHDLVRDVIVARLSAARRAALHRQVAHAMEREPGVPHVELLAHHFAQAGQYDKAFFYLEQVADRARGMCAYGEAESAYRDLAAHLERHGDDVHAADVHLKLGTMLMGLAHYDDALAEFEHARHVYTRTGALEPLGRVVAQIGWAYALAGRPEEGMARLQPLPGPLSTSLLSQRTLAELHLALAKLCMVAGRYDEQLLASERAGKLARAVDDGKLLAQAEMRRGDALQALGRTEEAASVLEDTIPLAEAVGEQLSLCFALNDLAVAYRARGDFERDRLYTGRSLEVAERLGEPTMIAFVRHRLGVNAWCRGDLPLARAQLSQSLESSDRIGPSWASAYPPLGMGMLLLASGDEAEALPLLDTARSQGERTGDIQVLRWAAIALAERDLLRDEPEAALRRLSPLLDRGGQQEALVTVMLPLVARAHLDLGDVETAAEVAEEARQRAARQGVRPVLVDALRVSAQVAARQGRHDQARAALEEALGQARTMVYPACVARTLYFSAGCYLQSGALATARAAYEEALAIFQRLGERPYAERAAAALAALRERG